MVGSRTAAYKIAIRLSVTVEKCMRVVLALNLTVAAFMQLNATRLTFMQLIRYGRTARG